MKPSLLFNLALLSILTSCSLNISQVQTKGTASDVIDTNQKTDPSTDLNLGQV